MRRPAFTCYRRFSQSTAANFRRCRSVSTGISATKFWKKWKTARCDVGIVTMPGEMPSLKVHSIFRDRLMLMVSPDNPLASYKTVSTADIAEQPLIFPKTGFMRQVLEDESNSGRFVSRMLHFDANCPASE